MNEVHYGDGNPAQPGLYVAYVNPEFPSVNRADRIFLLWDGKAGYYPLSDVKYRSHVYSHVGPLPILKLTGPEKSVS